MQLSEGTSSTPPWKRSRLVGKSCTCAGLGAENSSGQKAISCASDLSDNILIGMAATMLTLPTQQLNLSSKHKAVRALWAQT